MPRRLLLVAVALLALPGLGVALLAWIDRPLDVERIAAERELPAIPVVLPAASAPAALAFSVLTTGHTVPTLERFVYGGGSWFRLRRPVHMAVLVRHPQSTFFFDIGLGRHVDAQFAVNGWLDRLMFGYVGANPAADQLRQAALEAPRPSFVIPSHMHWDHVSALPDFPDLEVWATPAERAAAAAGSPPGFLASQFVTVQHWREPRLDPARPYLGFAASQDLFGDGSVVLVPLAGHTAGQLGMFLTLPSGERYLFTADAAWALEGLAQATDRSWLTRRFVGQLDHDEDANRATIVQLHRLMRAHPALRIVPAHDERVIETLPRFPAFRS